MKVTKIENYVDSVHEKFPELTRDEIKRILVYGWKMIVQYVSAGNDVNISSPEGFIFIGKIPSSGLSVFKTYCYKLSKKIRYMFNRKNEQWDGYYYFARTENQYKDYLSQSKKRIKTFKNVFLYKLLEEVKVREFAAPYIFRLKEDKTRWMRKYYPEIKTKSAELIIVRDCLNMQQILTTKNKFKYIE